MKKEHFDIKKVPGDGFLIFPLSMSRLSTSLSSEKLYGFLEFFEEKLICKCKSCDVILLYTNDLYLNSDEKAYQLREKILEQMLNHKSAFQSLLLKRNRFVPSAFHFIPWDYTLLNSLNFNSERARLNICMNNDPLFRAALSQDLQFAKREITESNIAFLIEELVVSHLLMEKEVHFSPRLSKADGWRLLCYPGDPPFSLIYLWKKNFLGNRSDMEKSHQLFARSFYNMESKILIDFNLTSIEEKYGNGFQIVKIYPDR